MEFRILGPLEVSDGERATALGGGKQRALLVVLLLRRNEVVSTDRLIEDLWSGRPPATALKIVQLYVSQLRKALGEGLLVTRTPGYLLRVEPGQLDAECAERLLGEARRALADGDPPAAADSLREALALWRGAPLSDFAYDDFAQGEIGRLGALRLDAVEERIEADLALGRHADLVPELAVLVRENPLRERLRGQLMLALYRCGRQAEALEIHREGRRALDEELGLQPGQALQDLERRILQHDPGLEAPARVERHPSAVRQATASPRRRRRAALLLAGAVLVGAAAAAAVFDLTRGGSSPSPPGRNFVAAVDPRTSKIVARIPVGTTPTSIAVGAGSVWVLNADDQTVSRINPATRSVATLSTGRTPTDLAVGDGAAWVGNGALDIRAGASMVGSVFTSSVSRIDLVTNLPLHTTALPSGAASISAEPFPGATQIAVRPSGVWVIDPDETLSRIDPRTGRVVARVRDVTAEAVTAGQGGVRTDDGVQTVNQIDTHSNTASKPIHLGSSALAGIAVGAGAVWVADGIDGVLWRIDTGPDHLYRSIQVGVGASGVAFGDGAVWVTNWFEGTLLRIDPRSNTVTRTVDLPGTPQGVAFGARRVWVTVNGGFGTSGTGKSPLVDGVTPVSTSTCGPIAYGGKGRLQYPIGSDLPLQGPSRTTTLPMTEAIQFVLQQDHFKAGRYTVGYQSCDDSTAQAGDDDLATCSQNAKAYGEAKALLGVIGTYNSDCAQIEVPIANRAGLGFISAQDTYAGLTHGGPGTLPGEPGIYYPSGRRNFVRIASPDDVEAAASALLAGRLGLRRVYLLTAGDDYGRILAGGFERAARSAGVEIAGDARWDPKAKSYTGLAGRIARSHADAVFLGGYTDGNLVRDVRARLGPGVQFLAPSGFLTFPDLLEAAGSAADGMLVSYPGVPDALLPADGRRFAQAFRATQPGGVLLSYGAVLPPRPPRLSSQPSRTPTEPAPP